MNMFIGSCIFFYTIWNAIQLQRYSEWGVTSKEWWIHIWPQCITGGMAAALWLGVS